MTLLSANADCCSESIRVLPSREDRHYRVPPIPKLHKTNALRSVRDDAPMHGDETTNTFPMLQHGRLAERHLARLSTFGGDHLSSNLLHRIAGTHYYRSSRNSSGQEFARQLMLSGLIASIDIRRFKVDPATHATYRRPRRPAPGSTEVPLLRHSRARLASSLPFRAASRNRYFALPRSSGTP